MQEAAAPNPESYHDINIGPKVLAALAKVGLPTPLSQPPDVTKEINSDIDRTQAELDKAESGRLGIRLKLFDKKFRRFVHNNDWMLLASTLLAASNPVTAGMAPALGTLYAADRLSSLWKKQDVIHKIDPKGSKFDKITAENPAVKIVANIGKMLLPSAITYNAANFAGSGIKTEKNQQQLGRAVLAYGGAGLEVAALGAIAVAPPVGIAVYSGLKIWNHFVEHHAKVNSKGK